MLEAIDLACERGGRLLFSGLSFLLAPGELLRVSGPNGSGKTSLLKLLVGLARPFAGEVHWRGVPIVRLGEAFRRELLYLGHTSGVKDELTALENLHFASRLGQSALRREQAIAALAAMGLAGREDLPARFLSQGQKRRVALARLMVSDAPLWILDEPLTALDIDAIAIVEARLGEHLARGGLIVLTTHQDMRVPAARTKNLALGVETA